MKQQSSSLKSVARNVLLLTHDESGIRPERTDVSSAILVVLNSVHKMTARDIAGRVDRSCEDTIDTLLHLEHVGMAYQLNGYWMLASLSLAPSRKVPDKTRRRRVKRVAKRSD